MLDGHSLEARDAGSVGPDPVQSSGAARACTSRVQPAAAAEWRWG